MAVKSFCILLSLLHLIIIVVVVVVILLVVIAAPFFPLSPSPLLRPQLVSVPKSRGPGCQMSGLVLSCQREEWVEMIDDWEA